MSVASTGTVTSVLDRFPGAELELPTHEMVTYCDRLWGPRARGFVCVGVGRSPCYDERGRYGHGRFHERYFAWPYALDELVTFARGERHLSDIFVAPALRASRSRRKGTARASRWLWADCDGEWTPARQSVFDSLNGAFAVLSGRGRHVYVPLAEPVPPEQLERFNRRLAVALDADAKWDSCALLRLPGTYNHKSTAAGGAPRPVLLA